MTTTALDLLLEDFSERPWGTIRAQVEDRLVYTWLALKAAQEGTAPVERADEHIEQAVAMLQFAGKRIKRLGEEAFQDLLNSDEGVAAVASMAAEREAAKSEAA